MSKYSFSDDVWKATKEVKIKVERLHFINEVIKSSDNIDLTYDLNEVYRNYQQNIDVKTMKSINYKVLGFIDKSANKDLKNVQKIDLNRNTIKLENYQLSQSIMSNHFDRLATLNSIKELNDKIRSKQELIAKLKSERQTDEICATVALNAKLSFLSQQLKEARVNESVIKRDTNRMMTSAKSLKTLIESYHEKKNFIMTTRDSIRRDCKLITERTATCHHKMAAVAELIGACSALSGSINNAFLRCTVQAGEACTRQRAISASVDVRLSHLGHVPSPLDYGVYQRQAYTAVLAFLLARDQWTHLIGPLTAMRARAHDYQRQASTISEQLDWVRAYGPVVASRLSARMEAVARLEGHAWAVCQETNDLHREWHELKKMIDK